MFIKMKKSLMIFLCGKKGTAYEVTVFFYIIQILWNKFKIICVIINLNKDKILKDICLNSTL